MNTTNRRREKGNKKPEAVLNADGDLSDSKVKVLFFIYVGGWLRKMVWVMKDY